MCINKIVCALPNLNAWLEFLYFALFMEYQLGNLILNSNNLSWNEGQTNVFAIMTTVLCGVSGEDE